MTKFMHILSSKPFGPQGEAFLLTLEVNGTGVLYPFPSFFKYHQKRLYFFASPQKE